MEVWNVAVRGLWTVVCQDDWPWNDGDNGRMRHWDNGVIG